MTDIVPAEIDRDNAVSAIVASGSGVVWRYDVGTRGDGHLRPDRHRRVRPDLVQSIAYDPGRAVYVGDHFDVTVHRPWEGYTHRIRVSGEPKALLPLNGRVLAAMFPSSEVVEIDPATDHVRSFGHDRQRPWEMVYDETGGEVLIASAARYGMLDGGLTILDPESGQMTVYTDVIPGQSYLSAACRTGSRTSPATRAASPTTSLGSGRVPTTS